jgi:hypothetical protein
MNLLNPKEAAKTEEIRPKSDLEISRVSNMEGIAVVRAFLRDAKAKYARDSKRKMSQGKSLPTEMWTSLLFCPIHLIATQQRWWCCG